MKVKITTTILGLAYGVEDGLHRGEVLDMPASDAAEAIRRGHAQLDIVGEPRRAGALPSDQELAELAALVDPPKRPLDGLRDRLKRPKEELREVP